MKNLYTLTWHNFCTDNMNRLLKTVVNCNLKASTKNIFDNVLYSATVNFQNKDFSTTSNLNKISGRYGHKLVKLWEEPEYTIKPLKVWRTSGRLPNINTEGLKLHKEKNLIRIFIFACLTLYF